MDRDYKKRVILVKSNTLEEDYRLPNIIKTLKKENYFLFLLCWNRQKKSVDLTKDNINFKTLCLHLQAPWGGWVFPYLPFWFIYIFITLMITDWDVAHVINFDSAIPTVIAGKIRNKPVIYEILETYEDRIHLPNKIRDLVIASDKMLMKLSSAVIFADEEQIIEFNGVPNKNIFIIYDSIPDIIQNVESKHNLKFTIFFAGAVDKMRKLNIEKMITAVSQIDDIQLILAGYGDMIDQVTGWAESMPDKVKFLGKINRSDVVKMTIMADLVFVLRDPVVIQYRYICGSTFLVTTMCGTPLLVNEGTSTAKKIFKENCGLVVNANNIEEIKQAIIKLRDNPELGLQMGLNGRIAFEQRYSWDIMEKRLLNLYNQFT